MKKRIIMIVMAAALAAGAAGCQGPKGAGGSTEASTAQGDVTSAAEGANGGSAPQEGPDGQDEAKGQVPGGNLDEIHQAVAEAYGDGYIPSMAYDAQAMEELFGIGPDLYDSYIAEGPMISAHVETFLAVRAKEGKGKEVESILNGYRDRLIEDGMQYPANLAKIQASEVARHGDDVYFVMLGGADMEAEEQGEEAALLSAKENNQIALDVIDGFYD